MTGGPGEIYLGICGLSDVGRERTVNEDAFVVADALSGAAISSHTKHIVEVADRSVLLAVTDGMGGENAGEIASRVTLSSLRHALSMELARGEPGEALRAAIEHANTVVTEAAKAPGREGMGATLVAVLVHGYRAYVGTVGDSRAYVLRRHGLVQVTKDQSFLQYLIDSGGIDEEHVATFPHKNVILQAVGRAPNLTVPVARIELRRDDVLLLCTDGLTGDVDDETIREVLSTAPLDLACSRLIAVANDRGGQDNITVLLASIFGQGIAEATSSRVVPIAAARNPGELS